MKKKLKNLFNEVDWNKAYMETIIDMGLNTVAIVREAKRQRLIAYLIGVVIGMAIGSLVMRAIYG